MQRNAVALDGAVRECLAFDEVVVIKGLDLLSGEGSLVRGAIGFSHFGVFRRSAPFLAERKRCSVGGSRLGVMQPSANLLYKKWPAASSAVSATGWPLSMAFLMARKSCAVAMT